MTSATRRPGPRDAIPKDAPRKRFTIELTEDEAEALKRIAYWKRIPLARIARFGILRVIDEMHSEVATFANPDTGEVIIKGKGEPYPPRMGELEVGRPSDT